MPILEYGLRSSRWRAAPEFVNLDTIVECAAVLRDAVARRREAGASAWVMTIAGFLLGTVTEDGLFKAAREAEEESAKDRECEAFLYAGWVKLINGDAAGAAEYFDKSVATGRRRMLEHGSAAAAERRTAPLTGTYTQCRYQEAL